MIYHYQTSVILISLGFVVDTDFVCMAIPGGVELTWRSENQQPTQQQIVDWATDVTLLPNGQLFSQWQAQHGGDPLATLRRKAREALDSQSGEQSALIRAVVLELLNYANAQRSRHNELLQWLGTQTNLINRNQLSAMQLAQATPTQARNAIKSRIAEGSADV